MNELSFANCSDIPRIDGRSESREFQRAQLTATFKTVFRNSDNCVMHDSNPPVAFHGLLPWNLLNLLNSASELRQWAHGVSPNTRYIYSFQEYCGVPPILERSSTTRTHV